jgi:very-short-patch-repair endonuclease
MKKAKIKYLPQFYELIDKKKRFRLDFAIICAKGKIAIECDNEKAHQLKQQKKLDKSKDKILRSFGWQVIRLRENQILFELDGCLARIKKEISDFGGQN